jgi:hypothetical protein
MVAARPARRRISIDAIWAARGRRVRMRRKTREEMPANPVAARRT